MQTKEKDNMLFMRLFPDEDLQEKLKEACKQHNVKTAVILCGLGQLKNVQLGYFREKNDYATETFHKPHELLSLTGNICQQDGEYILHLHAVLGNEQKQAIGGHLIAGTAEVTNEIVLLKTDIDITRRLEETTGLQSLFLE